MKKEVRLQDEQPEDEDITTGVNRRGFLKCMAWAGTGLVWTFTTGGLLTACGELATSTPTAAPAATGFTFIQISDSHIGFNSEGVNTDVNGTLKQVVDRINALPTRPALVLHTGDISHNSKPAELDTAQQIMTTIKTDKFFTVPGEHDVIGDQGAAYRQRFQTSTGSTGGKSWYSMDTNGVHFIALSNAGELDAFGVLGNEQLDWLKKDLAGVKKDTPLVVFAHVPLFTIYSPWGWETKDSGPAMALLAPYSNVTVLNGHIHQVLSKFEGNINYYTADATAFPQHRPGVEKPNAYKLPSNELLQSLGYRTITLTSGKPGAEIKDITLAGTPAATVAPINTPVPAAATPTAAAAANTTVAVAGANFFDIGAVADFSSTATAPKPLSLTFPNKAKADTLFVIQDGGQYLALSDICTHMGCEVNWSPPDNRFLCPCHGSEYDRQGKNVAGPAPKPLARYKTEVVNGRLLISVQPST